jgi:serine/threonine protein phosphatase PrpC
MRFLRRLRKSKNSVPPPAAEAQVVNRRTLARRAQVGWATDIGKVRGRNEDALLIVESYQEGDQPLPPFGFFALADGMGGHQSGEVASARAVRTAASYIMGEVYRYTLSDQGSSAARPSLKEAMVGAVTCANDVVAASVPGGGTTLTCSLVIGRRIYIGHVGDSRAYLVSGDALEQITQDHSLVDRLVEMGELTPDEAAHHPQKNVLYRAVGQTGNVEVDTYFRTASQGSTLLLCTDGLWGHVDQDRMAQIVLNSESAQDACEALVEAANEAGGKDNITAILVELPIGRR